MTKSIPFKTLDAFEELLNTLINGNSVITSFQIDDMVAITFSNSIYQASAYVLENGKSVDYVNKLAFSPAQIDAIESFAEDWHNGIVYHKHYDAEESQQDKLFTEFYNHYKG